MENKWLVMIIGVIVGFIAVFAVISGFSSTITEGSEYAAYPGSNCTGTGIYFNRATAQCYNSTNNVISKAAITGQLPLSSLFAPSGIVVIMLMIALLIIVIVVLLKVMKK